MTYTKIYGAVFKVKPAAVKLRFKNIGDLKGFNETNILLQYCRGLKDSYR